MANKKPAKKKAPTQKGDRHNDGKPKLSLVLEARHALNGAADVLGQGLTEYGRANWRKGLDQTEVCDSLSRHLVAFMAGENIDPKSGLPHVDHLLCNALFLAELTRTHPELDTRAIVEGKVK